MTTPSERGVVLLAAGRGSRMSPLTDETPKPMLEVGGTPLLERSLDQVLRLTTGEVTVVTGYRAERIEELVARRFAGRVSCVFNERFDQDVNILSVALGVDALTHPERGYTIIETDLLLERAAWEMVFAGHRGPGTFWVTRGRYGPNLTGGIVHADPTGRVDGVELRQDHDPAFDGWPKMLGILSVSPDVVAADREIRRQAIASTIRQYYLMPWVEHWRCLPSRILDLGDRFAWSFNAPEAFAEMSRWFLALEQPVSPP